MFSDAVAALREPGERAGAAARNRAVARVDGADEVARDERLPVRVRPHAVRPLLVGERAGRAERHHEDRGPDLVQRDELVLDDAEPDGRRGTRPAGRARRAGGR